MSQLHSRCTGQALVFALLFALLAVQGHAEDRAPLHQVGFPASAYGVVLGWSETSESTGEPVQGYRLLPRDGSPPFDVYLDAEGALLDAVDLDTRGIAPKAWEAPPVSAPFQRLQPEDAAPVSRDVPAPKRLRAQPAVEWLLPPLDRWAIEAHRKGLAPEKQPNLIGLVREADDPLRMVDGVPPVGYWAYPSDGRAVWAVQVHDAGAEAIRLYLTDVAWPAGTSVTVFNAYNPAEQQPVPAEGTQVWTPSIFSDTVILEINVPQDAVGAASFALAAAGHIFEDIEAQFRAKQAGACNLDVSCYPEYQDVADAVGWYTYARGSSLFSCTGALMADTDETTQIPYFMTANHCVRTTDQVGSMEVYWFFQTPVCDGEPPSIQALPRTVGATLLSTSTRNLGTDHTLARLEGDLPAGVSFLGWDGIPAPVGTPVVGVHHPRSTFKRIAFGPVTDCDSQSQYVCPVTSLRFYEVTWTDGVTEPGSSGSPIVRAGTKEFLGALWGGFAACDATNMADYYGRIEVTLPLVLQWLNPNPPSIDIATNGGENFSTRFPEVVLSGSVAESAAVVRVNGSTEGVSYTAGDASWSFSGLLTEGPNEFVVTASLGTITESASITVTLDTNPPVITLIGPNPDFVTLNGTYTDPGATAEDPEEGPVPVTVSGTVTNSPVGAESVLTYTASDSAGNTAEATRTVIVAPGPNDPPVLTITTDGGNGPGQDYATAEAALLLEGTVSDNAVSVTVNGTGEGVTRDIEASSWSFDGELEEGENRLVVRAASAGGQAVEVDITITLDATPPVITLFGDNPDTVFLNEVYEDPGAEAVDARDGPVEVTVTGTVISAPEGTESTLLYRAEDALGNAAEVSRVVRAIADPSKPPLVAITTNNGNNFKTRETVIVIAGSVTSNATELIVNGSNGGINFTPGELSWSFSAALEEGPNLFEIVADSEAGLSEVRTISVTRDTTPPVITLLGPNPDSVELGATYVDPGATAEDAVDGPVPVQVTGFVLNAPLGAESTLTYRASDSLGNTAEVTRTVVVAPAFSQPPAITIATNNGNNFSTNEAALTLTGQVTSNATQVQVNGSPDGVQFTPLEDAWSFPVVLTEGLNTFIVQAVGPGGESQVQTITIRLDTVPPVITLRGENPYFIPLGGPYIEPGADGFDPEGGLVAVTVTGSVATGPLGAESVRTYRAQDPAGNVTTVTRTVIVGSDGPTALVRLGAAVAPRTGTLSIPVVLTPSDDGVGFLDIRIQYDNTKLRFNRLEAGPAAEFAGATLQSELIGPGQVRLRATASAASGGVLVPGVIGRLVLGLGSAPLPLSAVVIAPVASGNTADGKSLAVAVQGATVHYIDGTLGPDSDGDGLSDRAEALLGTDPDLFDSNGNGYSDGFELVNGSDPTDPAITPIPSPLLGDLNIDGRVDSVDVQLVTNGALGIRTPMPTDLTGSGNTAATDVQLVINAALGINGG